jgi:hypothetical protein
MRLEFTVMQVEGGMNLSFIGYDDEQREGVLDRYDGARVVSTEQLDHLLPHVRIVLEWDESFGRVNDWRLGRSGRCPLKRHVYL